MNTIEHLLTCLIEEASEVQKAAAKALRFGLDDAWADNDLELPKWDFTPRQEINYELNDLAAAILLLREHGVLPAVCEKDWEQMEAKKAKILKMMEYARDAGTLTEEETDVQRKDSM